MWWSGFPAKLQVAAEKWPKRLFIKNTGLCQVKLTQYTD